MVNDKKIKRIVEYFSRKREGESKQLATIRERSGCAVAKPYSVKEIVKKSSKEKNNREVDSKLSESAVISILKKANEYDINPDILFEVYYRGYHSWNQNSKLTPQQIGFARINSYVMQGKSYYYEDKDLRDPCWSGYKQYGMKKKNGKLVPNCVPINNKKGVKND